MMPPGVAQPTHMGLGRRERISGVDVAATTSVRAGINNGADIGGAYGRYVVPQ